MANRAGEYISELWDSLIHGKKNKESKNQAIDDIDKFIDEYVASKIPKKEELPETPEYERLEYSAPDDDSIRASAQKELEYYKSQGEKGVDSKIKAQEKEYRAAIDSAEERRAADEEKTSAAYGKAKQNTDDDMLKRGIARSSIAANKKATLESDEAKAIAALSAEYSREINELEGKINSLASERETAMNDFNLAYAARLEERINALKSERDEKAAAVLKYNNSLTEKEHSAAVDKKMKESDLYSEALSQAKAESSLGELNAADHENIYTAVASSLRGMNKHDAREYVNAHPDLRNYIGSTYYYKLYDEFCR